MDTNKLHPTAERIDRLIRARYPIIVVQSHEEARVQGHIASIAQCKDRPKALYAWTISQGIQQVYPAPKAAQDGSATADPVAALRYILEAGAPTKQDPKGPAAIYLFKDLHAYLQDPVIMRLLRDVAVTLTDRHQTLILLSPNFNVPPDAEKDIAVVDFPLPTADELDEQLEAFISRLSDGVPCNLNGGREKIVRALQGLTSVEADACLAQAVIANRRLDAGAIPFILEEKAQIIRKAGALEYYPAQASYADIGGLDLLKAWCKDAMLAFSDEAKAYGLVPPKGVLIVGVQGCGKSLIAKAIAGGQWPLIRENYGLLFGGLVGQSEANTNSMFKIAEAAAPLVLWQDEIEKALGGGGELDGGTALRILGMRLTWMQETKAPIFTVATANDISLLRPEFVRRYDEVFFVDLPTPAERAEILAIHIRKVKRDPQSFDLEAIVDATPDFAGSEIEKIVSGALRRAFADGQREVTTDDLLAVAQETVPLAVTMSESIAKMREWAKRARPASSGQVKQPAKASAATGASKRKGRAIEM